MLPTNKATSSMTKPHGISVSGSVRGRTMRYLGGLVQSALDLVWYNGWKGSSSDVNPRLLSVTGGSAKKKSGKKGDTTYYQAAVAFALGLAPMRGVLSFWYNNQKFQCTVAGASGTVVNDPGGSGNGAFTFPVSGTDSIATVTGAVPSSSPYQVTAASFIADINQVRVNGVLLTAADPAGSPGIGQYTVDNAGHYNFNVAQAGGTYSIKYRKLSSGGGAVLAGIVAVTVHEPFTASFNDYGAPGPVNVAGTWEQPLWNAGYPVPGRIDAGAYRARDPYSYWQIITGGPTVYFPAALIGKPVTVYYGVPEILKSDGSSASDTYTPAQLLNLEFEPQCGDGAEYGNYESQRIVNPFASGLGSVALDLGATNAVPNLLAETIGVFTQFPNGDAEIADFITDLVMSGPLLNGGENYITVHPSSVSSSNEGLLPLHATTVNSVNEGDSGPPNYGDRDVSLTGATLWIQHSSGLNSAKWKTTWGGFGSGTPAHLYLNFSIAAPYGLPTFAQFTATDGVHSYGGQIGLTGMPQVAPNQLVDLSGWDLGSLTVSLEVWRTLSDNSYAEVTVSDLSLTPVPWDGLPNDGDQNVSSSGGSIWMYRSYAAWPDKWKIVWSGFGSGVTPWALLHYNLSWANSARPTNAWFVIQDGAGHSLGGLVETSGSLPEGDQTLDLSGWDLSTLTVRLELEETADVVYSPELMVTLAGLSLTTFSEPVTLQPVGHGCNLNDYTGTPVPGAGELLGDLTDMRNFCRAYGITAMLNLDSQRPAKDILDELLLLANTAPVYSGNRLTFRVRCEQSKAGNGAVFTAETAAGPRFQWTDRDFVQDGRTPHIKIHRKRRADCDNVVAIEFSDRSIDYGTNIVTDQDQRSVALYGPRKGGALQTAAMGQRPASGAQSMHSISNAPVGQKVANVIVRRSAAGLTTYEFEVDARGVLQEGMDLGTIQSDILGIPETPVRMVSMKETSKRTWRCEAEEFVYGLHAPREKAIVQATGSLQTSNIGVAPVNDPIIFEPPPGMTDSVLGFPLPEIWFIVSDPDQHYGGCAVYVSVDGGASYGSSPIAHVAPCTTGVLTADYPVGSDPDTTHTLALDLSESKRMPSSVPTVKAAADVDPCYVASAGGGFEIVCPSAVTPGVDYTCTAGGYVRRGVFGTTIADHPSGSRFGVATGAGKWQFGRAYIGTTLYFKFAAVNNVGGRAQDLSTCTAYAYTPGGSSSSGQVFQVNGT